MCRAVDVRCLGVRGVAEFDSRANWASAGCIVYSVEGARVTEVNEYLNTAAMGRADSITPYSIIIITCGRLIFLRLMDAACFTLLILGTLR